MSITDELREWKSHLRTYQTPEYVLTLRNEINTIADRIDAALNEECDDVSTKNGIFECSECGCTVKEDGIDWGEINYCPDCGKAVKR